jgi:saccharopine dehydrogenase-like NADP-dependent oxidoreductase
MNKVLVLGAGLVAKPLVDYLAELEDTELTVADIVLAKAEALTTGRNNATAIELDASDETALSALVLSHDIAVSLLPGDEHPKVARLCLQHGKSMSTASYVSPEMKEMDAEAAAKGLTFINECGVDPGMDHMSAMRIIHDAHDRGGRVVSFRSYCGGLPAPEANTNPIGYKFSWAPHGVLGAAVSDARYLKDGQVIEVPGDELFKEPEIVEFPGVGKFEGYPNRDSTPYVDIYDIPEVETLFRGTLRNERHCVAWYPWVKLGLFRKETRDALDGMTYRGFMRSVVGATGDPKSALATKLALSEDAPAIANLVWLGMFLDDPIPFTHGSNVDVLASRMLEKCGYADGERDMIVMQHEFLIRYDDRDERVYSTLVEYGIPGGDSAMARTVGLPLAIATRMVLDGRICDRGVVTPVNPEIYNPILDELEALGISFNERVA